jgi:hypothetical protein
MQRALRAIRQSSFALFLIALVAGLPNFINASWSHTAAATPTAQTRTRPLPVANSRAFVTYKAEGKVGCRDATSDEASALKRRAGQSRHIISPNRQIRSQSLSTESTGLQIVLRGTSQLENFPTAKAAFLNAAAAWEAVINTPITIVIDVDFGPTWFGERYDSGVLGQTDSQILGDSSIYSDVRSSLVGLAISDDRVNIYNQLPVAAVPTDIGTTTNVEAPSALWRALGFIDAVADPDAEQSDLGDPPAIGFNSAFTYDFSPTDGITSDQIDFDSVATHEIGHALGFDSNTGFKELERTAPVAVSVWDMFRFRPGTTLDAFTTATRILSSGGSQNYFDGSHELALSTGRPDGTGGDREQSSHWKDDRFTGVFIGIMDPTLADGTRETITDNDLAVLSTLGYTVSSVQNSILPTISNVSYNGRKLQIKGKRFAGDVQVEINGVIVTSALTFSVNSAGKKVQIKASQSALNLLSGTNQVRVISNGVASDAFAFSF